MTEIPPLTIPPDEDERERVRRAVFDAEVDGQPERAFRDVEEALYAAWATIDALRAAQGAGEALEEG